MSLTDLGGLTVVRPPASRGRPLQYGEEVALEAPDGTLVSSAPGGDVVAGALQGDQDARWLVVDPVNPSRRGPVPPGGEVVLRAADGGFLSPDASGRLRSVSRAIADAGRWRLDQLGGSLPVAPPIDGVPEAPLPDDDVDRLLAAPDSPLARLLDAAPTEQGDAWREMDGRRVPVVLATVRSRAGESRAGVRVLLHHGKDLVDQARTNARGLAVLRYPRSLAETAASGIGVVEVPGEKDEGRQVVFQVPKGAQHVLVDVVLDELPAASGPSDDPFDRLPSDFTPELYDDLLRLTGGVEDPILGGGAGREGGIGGKRSPIIKRLSLPRLQKTPGGRLRRFIVTLRQEWFFLGYSVGQLADVQTLVPGQRVAETVNTLERTATSTSQAAAEAIQEARSFAERKASELSSVDSLLSTVTSSVAESSMDATATAETKTTSWGVGGFLGIIGGGVASTEAKAKTTASVRARAALNTSALSQSRANSSLQANSLMRQAQSTLNKQVQTATQALRQLQTEVLRSVDQVSPLLSRATNLMQWTVYENYAVLSRVEDVKEVAATRVSPRVPPGRPLFSPEDVVEYSRFFRPFLLDAELHPHFDALRKAVEAQRNASRPLSQVRVSVEYSAQGSSADLSVGILGRRANIRLQKGGSRASAVLRLGSPVPQEQVRSLSLDLRLVGDFDPAPPHIRQMRQLMEMWRGIPFMSDAVSSAEAQVKAYEPQARVAVTRIEVDFSTVKDFTLTHVEEAGAVVTHESPHASSVRRLEVPRPAIYPEYDPLYLHVNRNRTYYFGLLLEAALKDPSLRDDLPQLARFRGDHPLWRLPILGFEGDRMIYVQDVDRTDSVAKGILDDPGAATLVQIASRGAYGEVLQGIRELTELKGRIPPALERPLQLVPPGYRVLDPDAPTGSSGTDNGSSPPTPDPSDLLSKAGALAGGGR